MTEASSVIHPLNSAAVYFPFVDWSNFGVGGVRGVGGCPCLPSQF